MNNINHTSTSRSIDDDDNNTLSTFDVLCGRDKQCYHHVGNRRFRVMINLNLSRYSACKSRYEKGTLISSLTEELTDVTSSCAVRFMKRVKGGGGHDGNSADTLIELDPDQSREKVAHSLRDAVTQQKRKDKKRKREKKKEVDESISSSSSSSVSSSSSTTSTTNNNINNNNTSNEHSSIKIQATTEAASVSAESLTHLMTPASANALVDLITPIIWNNSNNNLSNMKEDSVWAPIPVPHVPAAAPAPARPQLRRGTSSQRSGPYPINALAPLRPQLRRHSSVTSRKRSCPYPINAPAPSRPKLRRHSSSTSSNRSGPYPVHAPAPSHQSRRHSMTLRRHSMFMPEEIEALTEVEEEQSPTHICDTFNCNHNHHHNYDDNHIHDNGYGNNNHNRPSNYNRHAPVPVPVPSSRHSFSSRHSMTTRRHSMFMLGEDEALIKEEQQHSPTHICDTFNCNLDHNHNHDDNHIPNNGHGNGNNGHNNGHSHDNNNNGNHAALVPSREKRRSMFVFQDFAETEEEQHSRQTRLADTFNPKNRPDHKMNNMSMNMNNNGADQLTFFSSGLEELERLSSKISNSASTRTGTTSASTSLSSLLM